MTLYVTLKYGVTMGFNIGFDGWTGINRLTGDYGGGLGKSNTGVTEIETWEVQYE